MQQARRSLVDRMYPDDRRRRRTAMWRDAAVVAAVVLLAVLGWVIHELVDRVTVVATGVEEAGTSVIDGFDQAAGAVGGVPVVGGRLAGALSDVGESTGGRAVELGEEARASIRRTAVAAGLVTFVVPAGVFLAVVVPARLRDVRRLDAARALLADPGDADRRRLLAMRAAFGLPAEVLLRHSADPIGELAAGHLDGLLAAVLDDAGLDPARGR